MKPDTSEEDVPLTVADNGTVYQLDPAPAGVYLVTITLTRSGRLVYSAAPTVVVFGGNESSKTYTLGDGDFIGALPIPQDLAAVPNGTGIDLAWTLVPGADRYVIQRKPAESDDSGYETIQTAGAVGSYQDRMDLVPSSSYTYRVCAQNDYATGKPSAPSTATTLSDDATLSALSLSSGAIAFTPSVYSYVVKVANTQTSVSVTATAHAGATFTVNGIPASSGVATAPIRLASGLNTIAIQVTSENGAAESTYTLSISWLEKL